MGKAGIAVLFGLLVCLPPVPDAPPINEPSADGMILNPADVHMQAGPFNDPGGGTHLSTTWEIRKVSDNELVWNAPAVTDPSLKVHIHLADGAFVGSHAGRTTMLFDTDYRIHVRFTNNLGASGAESLRPFRTSPAGPPGVAGPMPWVVSENGYRVEKVAGGFRLPVNIAFVPNPGPNPTDPLFYVTELYGTIQLVRRNGAVSAYASNLLNYDPTVIGSFPGAGEQGLAGVCVAANGDLYATMMEEAGLSHYPKIVRLTSADGGITGTVAQSLAFPTETQGPSHQISNVSIGPVDNLLYVHVGDGFDPSTAPNLDSIQGKVLRLNLDLTPADTNPYYNAADGISARDYVFAYGMRNPFGGAWRLSDGFHYGVENGPSKDRLARIPYDRDLGWAGTDASMTTFAIHNWAPAHAPVNIAFVQPGTYSGSGFPEAKMDRAYVSESGPTYAAGPQSNGKRISEFQLGAGDAAPVTGPTTFVEYTGTGHATVAALAAGPDGLYFSDLYKDQPGGGDPPSAAGANIHRVRYIGALPTGSGTGFVGEYFATPDLTGPSLVRTDPTIDFFWADGTSPDPSLPDNNFSVRWRGLVKPRTTDPFTFTTTSDDGVRLWVDGVLIIDNWTPHAPTANAATVQLVAGQEVLVVMEYFEAGADATAKLTWSGPSQALEPIPASQISAPPPAPPAPPPARKGKKSCGATGLEVVFVFLLLRAFRRA